MWSDLAKIRKLADDIIPKNVKKFEAKHAQKEIEYIQAFDDTGITASKIIIGETTSVRFTLLDAVRARKAIKGKGGKISDLVLSHNHPPPGGALSFEDILMAIKYNAKKMRAVNPDGRVFELVRKKNYPKLNDFHDEIEILMKFKYPNTIKGSLEWQAKQSDLAIEKLGDIVEYFLYVK